MNYNRAFAELPKQQSLYEAAKQRLAFMQGALYYARRYCVNSEITYWSREVLAALDHLWDQQCRLNWVGTLTRPGRFAA
jgi:hypothetical protein